MRQMRHVMKQNACCGNLRCKLRILALVAVVFACLQVFANAQSKDYEHPSPLTSNEISGSIGGSNIGDDYYYGFTAGPGEMSLTIRLEAGRDSAISFNTLKI